MQALDKGFVELIDAIKFDVERQLRKSPEYKKFIEGATSRAINRILEAE